MLRVIAAFGEAPKVHDTIAIMLIRHWMREISKTTNIDQESHPDEPRPISR
ncbi:hypothetical protein [Nocardia mexicana]|nr:hypothetical protein [Nocardia mexicana]